MSSSGLDISELSDSEKTALETYTAVTGQAPSEAIPLLRRSQWNVQVQTTVTDAPYPLTLMLIASSTRLRSPSSSMGRVLTLLRKLARPSTTLLPHDRLDRPKI